MIKQKEEDKIFSSPESSFRYGIEIISGNDNIIIKDNVCFENKIQRFNYEVMRFLDMIKDWRAMFKSIEGG